MARTQEKFTTKDTTETMALRATSAARLIAAFVRSLNRRNPGDTRGTVEVVNGLGEVVAPSPEQYAESLRKLREATPRKRQCRPAEMSVASPGSSSTFRRASSARSAQPNRETTSQTPRRSSLRSSGEQPSSAQKSRAASCGDSAAWRAQDRPLPTGGRRANRACPASDCGVGS